MVYVIKPFDDPGNVRVRNAQFTAQYWWWVWKVSWKVCYNLYRSV